MKQVSFIAGGLVVALSMACGPAVAQTPPAFIKIVNNDTSTLTVDQLQFSIGSCSIKYNTTTPGDCGTGAGDNLYLVAGSGVGSEVLIERIVGGVQQPIFTATGGDTGTYDLTLELIVKVLATHGTVNSSALGLNGSVVGGDANDLTRVSMGESYSLADASSGSTSVTLATPNSTTSFNPQVYGDTFSFSKDFAILAKDATVGSTLMLNYLTQRFTPAPEPATLGLFTLGVTGLGLLRRKAANRKSIG